MEKLSCAPGPGARFKPDTYLKPKQQDLGHVRLKSFEGAERVAWANCAASQFFATPAGSITSYALAHFPMQEKRRLTN